jgi:hypothetical protein
MGSAWFPVEDDKGGPCDYADLVWRDNAVVRMRLEDARKKRDNHGILCGHGLDLRNRNGGGKTSARFRRFSSSTPTRLADGLGPIRLPFAMKAMRPDKPGPPLLRIKD